MTSFTIEEQNQVLDHLIDSRRTVRKFKAQSPPRPLVEMVLQAGLLAPYAQLSVTREDFRRFVIIPRESDATAKVISLMKHRGAILSEELGERMQHDAFQRSRGERYLGMLRMTSQQGPPNLGKAPYYVVVAEQRGVPDVAQLSLAHCLENMWLKANALGLGFQLFSITERMAEDKEFCELLGIPFGEYALDGCLLGYPDASPALSKRPSMDEVTRWI
ncbi:MAG: nitroreductase family protein [Methanomassiliicoccales archaeon]|nr:nitroreductase family protein [Methanomassiliicoccales archaeon]